MAAVTSRVLFRVILLCAALRRWPLPVAFLRGWGDCLVSLTMLQDGRAGHADPVPSPFRVPLRLDRVVTVGTLAPLLAAMFLVGVQRLIADALTAGSVKG